MLALVLSKNHITRNTSGCEVRSCCMADQSGKFDVGDGSRAYLSNPRFGNTILEKIISSEQDFQEKAQASTLVLGSTVYVSLTDYHPTFDGNGILPFPEQFHPATYFTPRCHVRETPLGTYRHPAFDFSSSKKANSCI